MYVEYLEYQRFTHNPVVEVDYERIAPYADAYIDNWTLDRVGKAVKNGEELPDVVKMVYSRIIDSVEDINNADGQVSSFSNGVDSYSFDTSKTMEQRVYNLCMNLLPVEWISACVDYEGGNAC